MSVWVSHTGGKRNTNTGEKTFSSSPPEEYSGCMKFSTTTSSGKSIQNLCWGSQPSQEKPVSLSYFPIEQDYRDHQQQDGWRSARHKLTLACCSTVQPWSSRESGLPPARNHGAKTSVSPLALARKWGAGSFIRNNLGFRLVEAGNGDCCDASASDDRMSFGLIDGGGEWSSRPSSPTKLLKFVLFLMKSQCRRVPR